MIGGFLNKNVLNSLLDKLENGISFAHIGQCHCNILNFSFLYSAELTPTQNHGSICHVNPI